MQTGLKNDLISGFSVFLLALPLCLGIAIASNFPPIAGIFTAIIGGMLASCIGSASLTIKGPAAGLIVIVLGAVQELGQGDVLLGYKLTLAVGVIAALVQIVIALFRKAVIAEVMPPFVIHGMLAAIGAIIISKQIYVFTGIQPSSTNPLHLLIDFPFHLGMLNPIVTFLGLTTFAIISLWPKMKSLGFIPSSIVILITVIPLSLFFNISQAHTYSFLGNSYDLGPKFLINLPTDVLEGIQFPDFSGIWSITSLKYILLFSFIGTIESLLTVCAVDALTEGKKVPADLNKDLMATGVANLASALIGGLPMISEIVRSKANIDYGATSAKANFFHGFFLLIALLFLPTLMNLIPLAALSGLLIFVGIRLASPKQFTHAWAVGRDQFAIFFTTFLVTLAIDLLVGVAVGIVLEIILLVVRGYSLKELVAPTFTLEEKAGMAEIQIEGPLTFLSFLKLKNIVESLAKKHKKIHLSLIEVTYLDHTVITKLQNLSHQVAGVELSIEENHQLVPFYNHPHSSRKRGE